MAKRKYKKQVKIDEIKNLSKTFQYNTFLLSQPNNTNTIIYHNVKNVNYATVLTLSYAMLQYVITDDILCCAHQTLMVIFPCGTNFVNQQHILLVSPDTQVSSTNKTDRHDKIEILLRVALDIITLTITLLVFNTTPFYYRNPITLTLSYIIM
jgi:hypothetical protein